MKSQSTACIAANSEDFSQVLAKRRELEAMLRFLNRNYVHFLCKGRLEEAAELLRMYRGLGEMNFPPNIQQAGIINQPASENAAPRAGM